MYYIQYTCNIYLKSFSHSFQEIRNYWIVPKICKPYFRPIHIHWTWKEKAWTCKIDKKYLDWMFSLIYLLQSNHPHLLHKACALITLHVLWSLNGEDSAQSVFYTLFRDCVTFSVQNERTVLNGVKVFSLAFKVWSSHMKGLKQGWQERTLLLVCSWGIPV